MRCSGLYDAKGELIKYRDIVIFKSNIWYIDIHDGNFIISKNIDDGEYHQLKFYYSDVIVIGSIRSKE